MGRPLLFNRSIQTRKKLVGLGLLMGLSSLAQAGTYIPPPPTVWNSAIPVVADGWIDADIPFAAIQNRLMFCDGVIDYTPPDPVCHKSGSAYSKPTLFGNGHLIPGPPQPFITPQEYLDKVAARHPEWHQKLLFSAMGLSRSSTGQEEVWLFYRVQMFNQF